MIIPDIISDLIQFNLLYELMSENDDIFLYLLSHTEL